MENRDVKQVIAALEKQKGRRADLAAVRYFAEVYGGTMISAPVGSPLDSLGAWSDNSALMSAESSLNGCKDLPPEKQKAASALLAEFGADLPVLLRAGAMAGEGKKKEAAALFVSTLESMAPPSTDCPSEHPMYSYRRVGRMKLIIECVKTIEPKRDVTKLDELIKRANFCAANNHAVG